MFVLPLTEGGYRIPGSSLSWTRDELDPIIEMMRESTVPRVLAAQADAVIVADVPSVVSGPTSLMEKQTIPEVWICSVVDVLKDPSGALRSGQSLSFRIDPRVIRGPVTERGLAAVREGARHVLLLRRVNGEWLTLRTPFAAYEVLGDSAVAHEPVDYCGKDRVLRAVPMEELRDASTPE